MFKLLEMLLLEGPFLVIREQYSNLDSLALNCSYYLNSSNMVLFINGIIYAVILAIGIGALLGRAVAGYKVIMYLAWIPVGISVIGFGLLPTISVCLFCCLIMLIPGFLISLLCASVCRSDSRYDTSDTKPEEEEDTPTIEQQIRKNALAIELLKATEPSYVDIDEADYTNDYGFHIGNRSYEYQGTKDIIKDDLDNFYDRTVEGQYKRR